MHAANGSVNGFSDFINRAFFKLGRETARYIMKKEAFFSSEHKVVSFTFDDFPVTAIENGARLLESFNAHGTFYTSLGIACTEQLCGRIATQQDMLGLSKNGHELGCHTFTHLNCIFKLPDLIRDDCIQNQKIASNNANLTFRTFAYPYGDYDPVSKYAISKLFTAARTIDPGINVDKIDIALLRSVELLNGDGRNNPLLWLERLNSMGGWLIFVTHSVSKTPSLYGCSIDLFEKVLEMCKKRGFQILTVSEALSLSKQK